MCFVITHMVSAELTDLYLILGIFTPINGYFRERTRIVMQAAQASVELEQTPVTASEEQALGPDSGATPSEALDRKQPDNYGRFLVLLAVFFCLFLGGIAYANLKTAPWIYSADTRQEMAQSMLAGENFGLFDLNIDIRGIRRAQFAALEQTPDVVLLGASHWQEAHADLLPTHDWMNAHVHRDYYDDILAAVEVMLTTGHLPKNLVITIRDATFTKAADRRDFLWIPFIPEFRAMEARLGLEKRPWYRDYPLPPIIDYFSLPTVLSNIVRDVKAEEIPGPTQRTNSDTLDVWLADGSVHWSAAHQATYSPERAHSRALEDANYMRSHPPVIDALAVESVDRVTALLQEKGVNIVFVHPPFNPLYFDTIQGSAYAEHLTEIGAITQRLANKYGASIAGSFDPDVVGCDSSMYIDAEHSRPVCLGKLLQLVAVHLPD